MAESRKDLIADAKSFCGSLDNVFLRKRRDAQTQHILEKARFLLDELVKESQRPQPQGGAGTSGRPVRGGMGQLWIKLDEMKRENDDLRLKLGRCHDDRPGFASSPKHRDGPGEEIISDLHKTRTENELLKQENSKLQKFSMEMESVNISLKDEYKRNKLALDTAHTTLDIVCKEKRQIETKVETIATENEQLKKDLENVKRSLKPVTMRPDNRNFENISVKCRPSVIAMNYNALESQEWVEAKESLEDTTDLGEDVIVKFLSSLLMNVYEAAQDMYQFMTQALIGLLRRPTSIKEQTTDMIEDAVPIDSIEQMPESLLDAVHSVLRQNCEEIDTKPIIEEAMIKCARTYQFDDRVIIQTKAVDHYLTEAARLCWQMIIQQPPMVLDVADTWYNEANHKLWWSCDQSCASNIRYYIWPALMDYEGGNVLVKGCVYCE